MNVTDLNYVWNNLHPVRMMEVHGELSMSLIESLASCFVLSVGLSSGFAAAVPVWRMYTKTLEQEYLFNRDRYIFEKFQDC